MESTNIPQDFHHEHEQKQQVVSASSSNSFHASSTLHGSWYNGASRYSSSHVAWSPNNSPNFINNVCNRIHQNFNTHPYNTSSRPNTGENDPWGNNNEYDHHQHQTLIPINPDQSSNKFKLDLFNSFMFPKLTDMMSSSHSSIEDFQHLSPMPQFQATDNFLSNSNNYSGYEGSSTSLPLLPSRGTFSQIFPSVNISNLNKNTHLNSTVSSFPLDINVQALDLLTSARFGGGISHDQTQQSHALGQQDLQLSSSPDKLLASNDIHGGQTTYTKRPRTDPQKPSSKKPRTESRPRACPPFKVRKEKLGDRIAALQQLVAPFGKTDTASVLMEAIGYIKFLQNQVETLSVPYMKSSRTHSVKPAQITEQMANNADYGNLESRQDLRSRGLCLVPLSCVSYVTNDDGGGWPSSDYGGGT